MAVAISRTLMSAISYVVCMLLEKDNPKKYGLAGIRMLFTTQVCVCVCVYVCVCVCVRQKVSYLNIKLTGETSNCSG